MNLDEKWNFEQKNSFFIKFQKFTKNGQKRFNFFKKKIKLCFALKSLLFDRKLIPKLALESS